MRTRASFILLLAALGLTGCDTSTLSDGKPAPNPGAADNKLIQLLSNRADLISGDDALIEILLPEDTGPGAVSVQLNGEDITSRFALRGNGRYMGLVDTLAPGDNQLRAVIDGGPSESLRIVNNPSGGPLFSGPQIQPWVCQEGAVDAQCNQPATYSFLYRSSDPTATGLQPYDPDNPPSDVAETTTDNGVTLPFIVRQEIGYQDRDQYKILTLFDPAGTWTAWSPQEQWNGKLLITHGGNCGAAHAAGSAPLDDYAGTIPANPLFEQSYIVALGKGYSVLSTALDNLGHNCNIAVQAESLIMAKERFVEQYGPLRYTIGTGCSGGSITQNTLANAYPGIYQGLLTMCTYPDVFGAGAQFTDYHLLRIYFEDPSRWGDIIWTPTQFADVEGHISHANAVAADEGLYKAALDPENPCDGVSDEERFDEQNNPGGVRCDVLTYMRNVLGPRQPAIWTELEQQLGRGFTGIPLSNKGIQYGLGALRQGLITPAHFVALNTGIGGVDLHLNWVPERIEADFPALPNTYRSGASNMANNMQNVASINFTGNDPGIAHDTVHAFWMRWRLDRAQGHHDNHVMWGGPAPLIGDPNYVYLGLDYMSDWLDKVIADDSAATLAEKIATRPDHVHDQCSDGDGHFVLDEMCPDPIVQYYGTPRTVAGDDIYGDSLACQLRPFSREDDYGPIPFSEDQWLALEALFADGVCDYSLPPLGQQDTVEWLSYQDADGGVIHGGEQMREAPYPPGWADAAFAAVWDRD